MRIIILGADAVGSALARSMTEEGNDVTLIDEHPERLRSLQHLFDMNVLVGRGSHPEVLRQADAEDADMLVALTKEDEVNIIGCRVAHTLFNVPTKIAVVRNRAYLEESDSLFGDGLIPIDALLNPDQIISDQIHGLIRYPGTLQFAEFSGGCLLLICVVAREGGSLIDHPLSECQQMLAGVVRIAAVYRNDKAIIPDGDMRIYPGDEIFFFAPPQRVGELNAALGKRVDPFKRIIIAGGNDIGVHLAEALRHKYHVKLIERDIDRAKACDSSLDGIVILHGNPTDENVLSEENIHQTDIFCAVTDDDEDNILSALLAKHLGARKVLALVNDTNYIELIRRDHIDIDIALSRQQITLSELLCHVRRGDTIAAYSLRRGNTEALEIVAHGDTRTSRIVGRQVARLRLPPGCMVCGIIRGGRAIPVDPDRVIESGDHIIFFIIDKKHIPDIEKLFQVNATFL